MGRALLGGFWKGVQWGLCRLQAQKRVCPRVGETASRLSHSVMTLCGHRSRHRVPHHGGCSTMDVTTREHRHGAVPRDGTRGPRRRHSGRRATHAVRPCPTVRDTALTAGPRGEGLRGSAAWLLLPRAPAAAREEVRGPPPCSTSRDSHADRVRSVSEAADRLPRMSSRSVWCPLLPGVATPTSAIPEHPRPPQ